jgi:hypothetical protein
MSGPQVYGSTFGLWKACVNLKVGGLPIFGGCSACTPNLCVPHSFLDKTNMVFNYNDNTGFTYNFTIPMNQLS